MNIRLVKISLVIAAVVISVASLMVSHYLTLDLSQEERSKMETGATAMRGLSKGDENTDLELVLKVINENNTIPVVVMDSKGNAQFFRNIEVKGKDYADSLKNATALGRILLNENKNIRISIDDGNHSDYINVCYNDSLMLKRLHVYPFVQLGVVMLFVVVAIFALLTSKKAEQNKVWVGLSKETAHQLGTPISSLMAWIEILKENYPQDELIPEMDKDISRLQLIADRFSKIGSTPEVTPDNLNMVITHVAEYMDTRTSKKIKIIRNLPENDIIVNLNAALFEWVVENLCKNAVDAMGGESGSITLSIRDYNEKVAVEVADTGRGIKKKDLGNVFRPGFTTKKRGWGLGLSLARRIIEQYHMGRIFVERSEVGVGTTFRIELPRNGRQ